MQFSLEPGQTDKLTPLLKILEDYFSLEELATLSFELGVGFESLPANGKAGKARELLLQLHRDGRLPELIDSIHTHRPRLKREEITSDVKFETLPEAIAFLFSEEEIKTLAFALSIDYENLPAIGKLAKVDKLVCSLKRNDRLPDLIKLCQKKRPNQKNLDQLLVSCPRFSRQQIVYSAAISIFLVVAGLFWLWWPPPLADGFNVVVAEFAELDENGRIQRTDESREISQQLYEAISKETEQLPPTLRFQIREPGLVGIVDGVSADERAANGAKIAARHNATILIYGIISTEDGEQHIALEFFVSDESFGYGSEVAGPDRLGKPILLDGNLDPEAQFELNEALNGRSQALQRLVKGLANYYIGQYEQAYADFKWAEGIQGWADEDGKEVIYLLMGAARLQAYNSERLAYQLESARSDFIKARSLNGNYARSYLGLGAVTLANVENLGNDTRAISLELTRAEGLYLTALLLPDQPELAYIRIKAANGVGDLYLRARQSGISSWPGQQAEDLLNCIVENEQEYVVEIGQCAFTQVIDLYAAEERPSDLKWLTAHAHAKLGILAGYDDDWPTMISESRQAIEMLEELPPEVVTVNQGWIARYWGNIGLAQNVLGQVDDAIFAYQSAIRIGTGNVSDEEIAEWEEAITSLEKGS